MLGGGGEGGWGCFFCWVGDLCILCYLEGF